MKIIALFITLFFVGISNKPSTLNDAERKYALEQFENSKQKFLDELKGLTPEQLNFKAAPDKWSIAEVAEHICLSETTLAGIATQNLKTTPDSSRRGEVKLSDTLLRQILANRTGKAQAPEVIKPKGKFANIQEAITYFNEARNTNMQFLKTTQEDLRNRYWKHPLLGMLDLYQVYLLVSGHCERHTAQIVEVKQSVGYPK